MTNFQEGMIAIFVCLVVFNLALLGIVVVYILKVAEMHREAQVERIKTQVLVDSVMELFEEKYKLNDDENESDTGSNLPRRD